MSSAPKVEIFASLSVFKIKEEYEAKKRDGR